MTGPTKLLMLLAASSLWLLGQGTACLAQTEAGEALAVVNEAKRERISGDPEDFCPAHPGVPGAPLDFQDSVLREDVLRTEDSSQLIVLLDSGAEVSMAAKSCVFIEPSRGDVQRGTVRAVVDQNEVEAYLRKYPPPVRPAEDVFVLNTGSRRNSGGRAIPRRSSVLVSCGPPSTDADDDCLFVGVYGLTEVSSLAFPDQPVTLRPRFFTRVRPNQRPDPDPPQRMEEARYLRLIDSTTIIGSGSGRDRLGWADADPIDFGVLRPRPPRRGEGDPQEQVFDQPIPPGEGLPDPPRPPPGRPPNPPGGAP